MGACHVYKAIAAALSEDADAESALSVLTSPQDALAAAVHACILQSPLVEFVDATLSLNDSRGSASEASSSDKTSKNVVSSQVLLPKNWNSASPNFYAFIYRLRDYPGEKFQAQDKEGEGSSDKATSSGGRMSRASREGSAGKEAGSNVIDLTITRLGMSNVLVSALNNGTGRQASCKLQLRDYINENVFTRPDGSEELQDVYRSEGRIEQLGHLLQNSILMRVCRLASEEPGDIAVSSAGSDTRRKSSVDRDLSRQSSIGATKQDDGDLKVSDHQIGEEDEENNDIDLDAKADESHDKGFSYEDEDEDLLEPMARSRVGAKPPLQPNRVQTPLEQPVLPRGTETPPGFEDEYEMRQDTRRRPSRHDLPDPGLPNPYVPIGGDDIYPPGIGRNPPLGPFGPTPGSGSGEHQGMHPTFNHPIFQRRRSSRNPDRPDDLTAPPGARWDPTGPSGNFGPNRFI